ncbi:hypothetical protein EDD17DRAFT_1881278 [Pisolithus thermaeus]|nr:hypothetical protein EV401DRAFT_2065334 [Pisolithus croceorrhizus]KAI6139886.1 hypothetical protein EDD17DRAFT_1881278 [Pisolithus thermaeus]
MHACLRIAEILDLIISFMDIGRFARTCKAFKNPALDVLWRTQPSLSPLIMCLSGHLWTRKRDQRGWVVSLREEPSHEDWLGLQRYSHRIRVINCCTQSPPPVCPSTLDAVFSPNLSQELFPSLRTLNLEVICDGPGFIGLRPIALLNSVSLPRLVRLAFAVSRPSYFENPRLHFKPACARSLRALTISVRCGRIEPLIVNFGDFPYLRRLCLWGVPSHSGHELIRLQYLCDLAATLPNGFDFDVHSSTQPILPSLQRLNVSVGTLNQVTNLLSSITSSDLGSVKFFCRSPATQSDTYALFRAIERVHERSPNFGTLDVRCLGPKNLSLVLPTTTTVCDPSYDLPRSTLALVLACHHLRVFKLSCIDTLGIDNAFIREITLAWPGIEVLHLHGSSRNIPHVSLEGLHELLWRCQRLSSLGIQIDARTVPEEEPEMRSLPLKTLLIDRSRVTNERAVERYLRILAPKLKWLRLPSHGGLLYLGD